MSGLIDRLTPVLARPENAKEARTFSLDSLLHSSQTQSKSTRPNEALISLGT